MKDTHPFVILVIEDNAGDYCLVEEYLLESIESPTICHAKNFEEARRYLSESSHPFDAVLLDLSLPDLGGEDLLHRMLSLCHHVPVIVLTGFQDIHFSLKSLHLGVSDYLNKDQLDAAALYKSLLYSKERKMTQRQLEESQRLYSQLFHLTPNPMWVYRKSDGRIMDVNQAAMRQFGYQHSNFLQLTIDDLMTPVPEEQKEILKLREGLSYFHTRTGESIWAEVSQSPLPYNNEPAMLMLINDVSGMLHVQQRLKEAYIDMISIEDQEKERFASEIHDSIAQNLVALRQFFSFIKESHNIDADDKQVSVFEKLLNSTITECRAIMNDVRPKELADFGLHKTMQGMISRINALSKISMAFESEETIDDYISYNTRFHIFRILQECINNTLKHANATQIQIEIMQDDGNLMIGYSDNGNGIPEKDLKLAGNFQSIKRRVSLLNGVLHIENLPKGVSFDISIPLQSI